MNDNASEQNAQPTKTAAEMDMARKIWLAGVGAYGRVHAETQEAMEKLSHSAADTFEQLVVKGEEIEERVRKSLAKSPQAEKVSQAVESATAKAQAFSSEQKAALEARLEKVRGTFSGAVAPWNLPALGQTIEKLNAQVEALSAEVAALKASRGAAPEA
jgi:poly(hydroxyalkanoate) granule-associated protein